MAVITFYGKPNCINNRKQRDILIQAGHTVLARDILLHHWTQESLLGNLISTDRSDYISQEGIDILVGEILYRRDA